MSRERNPVGMSFTRRFGSAGNLHLHLHIVAIDGAYEVKSTGRLKFYNAKSPTENTITCLAGDIAKRVNRLLIKEGLLEHHEESNSPIVANTENLLDFANDVLHLPDTREIRLRLKTPWRDGTEALLLSPMKLIERLVALIPPPCFHMTRYLGALASASKHRNELPDRPKGSVELESAEDARFSHRTSVHSVSRQ